MRRMTLALLGAMLAAGPALADRRTGAADRPGGTPAKHQAAAPGQKSSSLHLAAHHGGRRGVVRAHYGWTQGLPPAAGVQANECPDGTMATLARGHDDVVRCMPI